MTDRFRTVRAGLFGLMVLTLGTLAACSHPPKLPEAGSAEADKFLFDRCTSELNAKHWIAAREYFRRLVDSYPQSPYRADAKLGIGDAFLGENHSDSRVYALNEFREFLQYFPTNPKADYAQYKMGLAHFRQMSSADRDQTETRAAIKEFQGFLQRWPNSQYKGEVERLMREARDRLSDYDFRVGMTYYKLKFPPGAIGRFKGVLAEDPQYTGRDAVYFYLGESLVEMKQTAEALPYYERLVKEFTQSEYLDRAKARITELKKGT